MSMRIAWLAPYSAQLLEPQVTVMRRTAVFHPCSWIVNLSSALARTPELELHIITESTLVAQRQVVRRDNITYHVLKTGVPFTHRGFPYWCPLDILTGFSANVRQMLREIGAINPDLVHGHGTEVGYALTAVKSKRPCLISIQGVISEIFKTSPILRYRLVRKLEQQTVRQARFFTCRTRFDSGFVLSQNPQARIFMIPEAMNPVFFEKTWSPSEAETILFVGSLLKENGIFTLLEALAVVARQRPRVLLQIIGGASLEQRQSLQQFCERLGIQKNVEFRGFKLAAEIARYHQAAQMFVMPSENENSPNALAEAMVSGMPVIASDVGGIPSMVQAGESGVLVKPQDPQQLSEAILRLLSHPEERQRLGANAQRAARARHWPETVAAQTVAAYQEILRSAKETR